MINIICAKLKSFPITSLTKSKIRNKNISEIIIFAYAKHTPINFPTISLNNDPICFPFSEA